MLSLALREPEVRDQHWAWTRDNFPAIVDRIPTQWRRYTPGMARPFCERDKLTELIEVCTTSMATWSPVISAAWTKPRSRSGFALPSGSRASKLAGAIDTL